MVDEVNEIAKIYTVHCKHAIQSSLDRHPARILKSNKNHETQPNRGYSDDISAEPTMTYSRNAIVIGGGVIGLSLAWELAQRGRSVTVLEAGQIGKGASWAGAGILPATATVKMLDPYESLRSLSHRLHPDWAERLQALTGIDTGFRRCGGIYLACSPGEAATLAANRLWWQEHGIEHQSWTLEQLRQREPQLANPDAGRFQSAWFLPDECQLRNPHHLRALAAVCRMNSVELLEDNVVDSLEVRGNERLRVTTPRGEFEAEQVCICSGAWARQTLTQLGVRSGILPIRGQMILYRCSPPPLSSIVNVGHRYLVPRSDGRLLAGSVEEEVGYKIETTEAAIAQIHAWALSVLPRLEHVPIEKTWAGLRPGTFDGLPYLGAVPGYKNLFVAAGHFRSGLHLSCATAIVMANHMEGVANEIDLTPFRVARG